MRLCPPPGKPHHYVITVYALNTSDLRLRQSSPALMSEHEIRTTDHRQRATRRNLRALNGLYGASAGRIWLC
ncbi:MAG: hypothetical protein CBARDMAM_4930 [uncultured Caballeronia sp.]|nr:MAG: hypothetical protein CBARDMAM_4930 [uncultured Caballeronia sp.]